MNRLLVSTECPTCGAPLDFSEGSNAITCGHCRSNLLVTGKKQTLSYYVASRLEERKAIALATMAQRNLGRSDFLRIKAQLYFLPYYRMTGQDFGWEEPPSKPVKEEESSMEQSAGGDEDVSIWTELGREDQFLFGKTTSLFEAAGELLNIFRKNAFGTNDIVEQTPLPDRHLSLENGETNHGESCTIRNANSVPLKRGSLYEKGEVVLNDRYVERNFLACDLKGVGLYSLGVRPAVLKLSLFHKEVLGETGRIVNPSVTSEIAQETGLKTALNPSLLYRQVIEKVLSVIYFPFWIVEMESRGRQMVTIIDAVAQTVVKPDAPVTIHEILNREFTDAPTIIGFRPLTCPNCGWDLPVRPDDSIFFCSTCKKAWEIFGKELNDIPYEIAGTGDFNATAEIQYLPFWLIASADSGEQPFRYYIPAFRYRRLKLLLDLALCLSRIQPEFSCIESGKQELSGCYYDSRDAAMLAQFSDAALRSDTIDAYRSHTGNDLLQFGAKLIWFPFEIKGAYLVAPFAKINIPKNLLL
jgi:DNA-directed RNA polymerase subunit RPC12/RpoP